MVFSLPVLVNAADVNGRHLGVEESLPLLDSVGPVGTIDENGNIHIPEEIQFSETENGEYIAFVPLQRVNGFGGALTMNVYQFQGSVYEVGYKIVATGYVNGAKFNYSLKQGNKTLCSGNVNDTFGSTKLLYKTITKTSIFTPATVTGKITNCLMYSLEYGWLSGNSNSWTWNF